ncbi:MAG: amidohydrolase [Anaerolineales bacterium]|nr:amidohydrolase [Anaerolineales bacterium]
MPQPADFIIENARVWTGDPQQPVAEAVAVRGRRIAYVGTTADARGWRGPATRLIDGQNGTVTPGFIDSHLHLLYGSLNLSRAQLYGLRSRAAVITALKEFAVAHPDVPWVQGRGAAYDVIQCRADLDAAVSDRPVLVIAYDGHTGWANTRALELAGILRGGEVRGPNSVIVRDAAGLATGELRETGAIGLVEDLIAEPSQSEKRRWLVEGVRALNRSGVTAVHNMNGDLKELELYREAERDGELTLRVYVPFHIEPHTAIEALPEAAEMARIDGLARGGAVKFFMDGVLESWTALMVAPYADQPDSCGDALFSLEHFVRMAGEADRMGLQIAVHCCGDGAVRRTLDGYARIQSENGPRERRRHRIEHIEVIHPDDLPRFKQLGVIGSVQPLHAPTPGDGDVWMGRAGRDRWGLSFAWRTLQQAGVRLALGSDWPVADFNPLAGIAAGLTRQPWQPGDSEQALTLEELLVGYTRDAAYTELREHERGRLRIGYLADLVLLDGDLARTAAEDPAAVARLQPALTVVDGSIAHAA